jgi:hypothetical protein
MARTDVPATLEQADQIIVKTKLSGHAQALVGGKRIQADALGALAQPPAFVQVSADRDYQGDDRQGDQRGDDPR